MVGDQEGKKNVGRGTRITEVERVEEEAKEERKWRDGRK